MASRFERLGLVPVGPDRSFFQPFNLTVVTLGDDNLLEVVNDGGASMRLRPGQDYYPHRFGRSGRIKGPVVFAGFGFTAPALSYDDYRAEGVKGKIVLILDHEPWENDQASPFDGVVSAEAAVPFRKVLAAQDAGAIGVLFVADVHNHSGVQNFEAVAQAYWPATPPRIDRFFLTDYMDRIRIPAAQISPAQAAGLIRGTNRSLEDLSRSAEAAKGMTPVPLPGAQVELTLGVNRHIVPDRSVVALWKDRTRSSRTRS